MTLLPRVPHHYDNATAEACLEYALEERDPQLVLQSARMVACLRSFCRSCTEEQFNALKLMPGATSHLPPKSGARKRRLTRPGVQSSLRPSAKANPWLPPLASLPLVAWPGSQQQSYPSIRKQADCGSAQWLSSILPGREHRENKHPQQEQSISLNTSLTLPIPSGEGSQVRHPGPPSLYFRGRADATIIAYYLEHSFEAVDKIIDAPSFQDIWGTTTLSKRTCGNEQPSGSRLHRLYTTYQEIERFQHRCALGLRVLVLMMHHERQVLMSESRGNLKKGQRLESYANEQIATEWEIEESQVKYKFKQAKRYLALIRPGPGCLLYVKSSTWETRLKDEQVDVLCEYLERVREHLILGGSEGPERPNEAKVALEQQNFGTAKLIIKSLCHFGWTREKLAKSGTDLMEALGDYVDLRALESGRICDKEGRDFQGYQACEMDGEDDGIRGDEGDQREAERHDVGQDATPETSDARADLSQACKRRRTDSGQPSDPDRGRSAQQNTASPQSRHRSVGSQGPGVDGQAVQHGQNAGQPSQQSTNISDVSQGLDDASDLEDAEDRHVDGTFSFGTMPKLDLGSVEGIDFWGEMINFDHGIIDSTRSLG